PTRGDCEKCILHAGALSVGVPTVHLPTSLPPSPSADFIVFVGQNPGFHEDREGVPFIGRSGEILREAYIDGVQLAQRASVYLTTAVRCGPVPKYPAACPTACFPFPLED